jgi:hypothetical protein
VITKPITNVFIETSLTRIGASVCTCRTKEENDVVLGLRGLTKIVFQRSVARIKLLGERMNARTA